MLCLKCNSEDFVLQNDAEIEQVFRGVNLKVKSPAMACSKCGWLALTDFQATELRSRTRDALREKVIDAVLNPLQ